MLKFTASGDDGRILVGLGLEEGNVTKLREGKPAIVRLSDFGFEGAMGRTEIMIYLGKDLADLRQQVAAFISPETVIIDESHQPRRDWRG